ncbi:hypothetical protein DAI22_06g191600 [Oryza sativa Japonica Group]|nr:hypothetical protein DAI22_06g191600 [Oryza sativa Japonica Group]
MDEMAARPLPVDSRCDANLTPLHRWYLLHATCHYCLEFLTRSMTKEPGALIPSGFVLRDSSCLAWKRPLYFHIAMLGP